MSQHPVFLIVHAKLAEAAKAVSHMNEVHAQQCGLQATHPGFYSLPVHAESLVTNVQGIYTHLEAILKTLANVIDGFTPTGDAWHRDLLLQAAASDENRPQMISSATMDGMSELLKFRHAIRNNYAATLRHDDVFRNLALLQQIAPAFFSDIVKFADGFGTANASTAK